MNAKAWSNIIIGGLVLGTLDLVFAWAFWAGKGATLADILRSIARGWYGDAARDMGMHGAVIGALSHYGIAIAFVLAYWLVARRWAVLRQRPLASGALYGLALYGVMNFIVQPLSAAGMPSFGNTAWVASSIALHAGLGMVAAWFATRD